ncbi:MAG: CDP-alcohol phosphatidyltransferase family protein [Candidatus Saccharimonas sp.]
MMDLKWSDIRDHWASPPNLVSYARVLLIVPICFLVLQPGAVGWIGFGLLVVAALSDKLDGWLAKRNDNKWVTKWGKFIDPIIDKIFVLSVMAALCVQSSGVVQVHLIIVAVLVAIREVIVLCVKSSQPVASAAEAGRASMVVQSAAIAWFCFPLAWGLHESALFVPLYIGLGISLVSGWLYFVEWKKSRRDRKGS